MIELRRFTTEEQASFGYTPVSTAYADEAAPFTMS